MNKKWVKTRLRYSVVCAWCGALIRRDNAEDAQGMCFPCYYRVLKSHLSARQHKAISVHASDR